MAMSNPFTTHQANMLSNSLNSIASLPSSISGPRATSPHLSKAYRQSSHLFLTRRLPEALSTIQALILPSSPPSSPSSSSTGDSESQDGGDLVAAVAAVAKAPRTMRIKVWSLYLTILNAIVELGPEEGKDTFGAAEWRAVGAKVREGEVWEEVVRDGYHGVEGDVDADVVINLATLLLAHARSQTLNQKRLESFLATSREPMPLDLSSSGLTSPKIRSRVSSRTRRPSQSRTNTATGGADTPRDLSSRVKILELYTLHVLPRNDQWDYAHDFISVSTVLDEERRDAFLHALQSLRDEHEEVARREAEERQRQDDLLKTEMEDARKLRTENEAKEGRRMDEERKRREGGEVDYGSVTNGKPVASSALSRLNPNSAGQGKGKKRVAAVSSSSLAQRAAMVLATMKHSMEHLGATFREKPMLLLKLVVFVAGLLAVYGNRRVRERIARVLGVGWEKVRKTAGMGAKVSYI